MLVCLRIQNLAIVERLELSFEGGLNVITGETGAGKSILVDALELVLGGRGDPELVRTGEKAAEVEAVFDLRGQPEVRARVEASGIELDEGEVVIRRVVPAAGRSRAYVNGRMATTAELTTLAHGLADISSQHEYHLLTDPQQHLEALDAFAGLVPAREAVGAAHAAARAARLEVDALVAKVRDRGEREDLLRFQMREIDELAPVEGETESLAIARDRLRHATKLARAAGTAEDALVAGDTAVLDVVGRVESELRAAAALDPQLAPLVERLEAASAELEAVGKSLGRYARGIEVDPERLAEVEERLDKLKRLERKYGGGTTEILAHRARAAEELATLTDAEGTIEAAEARATDALVQAADAARALRARRVEAAGRLGAAISAELASLGMGGARIEVQLSALEGREGELLVDGARLSASGIDRAEFLIAPNLGEEAKPLRRIASGGELSRAMLAIKRVLAGLGARGLYVFDEVDTGVGGAVADVIGQKLVDVARHHQVVCITHLPQIASYGSTHFHVRKAVSGERTRSVVARLEGDTRVEEIARMLGAAELTDTTRAAARELVERAAAHEAHARAKAVASPAEPAATKPEPAGVSAGRAPRPRAPRAATR